jgi:hypothetical protein
MRWPPKEFSDVAYSSAEGPVTFLNPLLDAPRFRHRLRRHGSNRPVDGETGMRWMATFAQLVTACGDRGDGA